MPGGLYHPSSGLYTTSDDYVPIPLWDQNGFIDRTLSTIAFNDGLLRLTIAPTGADYEFLQAGVTYRSNGDTFDISNNNGLHMIYYDTGVLAEIVNPTEAQVDTAIEEYCLVAMVMWDVTGATGYLMDERHGMRMSPVTHHWIHDAVGAVWLEGLALGNFTIGAGAANADAQFSTSAGAIYDEDIRHELTAVAVGVGLQIWYLDGANWRWTTNAGYSILLDAVTGRMAYNNAGAQAAVPNNQFALCHVFATNGTDLVPIAIQGQASYPTLNQARDGAETEIANLTTTTLPLPEIKPLGTVIFQTANAYGNAVLSRVRTTGAGDNYVDWRTSPITASSPGTDHGALGGLVDDDHLQYALLAGRAGGQTLIGGIAASENLVLQSTSDAVLGYLDIQSDLQTDRWLDSATNIFIGRDVAGAGNLAHAAGSEGWNNSAIGYQSMHAITTGYDNAGIGYNTLNAVTTGYRNVAIGMESLLAVTTGYVNIGIGYQAGQAITIGHHNVAIAPFALHDCIDGNQNIGIGFNAGHSITTGSFNSAIGSYAHRYNQTGSRNAAIGYQAGQGATGQSHDDNVFIGNKAGLAITTGDENTFIGARAGEDITTGAGNVAIGFRAGESRITNQSDLLYIENSNAVAPLIFGDFANDFLIVNGLLGIALGITAPNNNLQVHEASAGACLAQFTNTDSGSGAGDGSIIGIDAAESAIFWNQENLPLTLGTNNLERVRITGGGKVGIGTTSIPHGAVGYAKLVMDGTNASAALGPHIQITTDADDHPVFQLLNWSHDDIELSMDAYWGAGFWRSSDVGSNFQIIKTGDVMRWQYDSAVAAGNVLTWNPGIGLTAAGLVGIGTLVPVAGAKMEILSTTGALLLPRMTTVQRNALAGFTDGMIIYNTTTGVIEGREGGAWVNL